MSVITKLLLQISSIYWLVQPFESNDIIEYYYTAIFILQTAIFDSVCNINIHDGDYELLRNFKHYLRIEFSLSSCLMSSSVSLLVTWVDKWCLYRFKVFA